MKSTDRLTRMDRKVNFMELYSLPPKTLKFKSAFPQSLKAYCQQKQYIRSKAPA